MKERSLPVSRACRAANLGRSNYYRPRPDRLARDAPVIERLNEVVAKHGRWGFWKCFHWMRLKGETWNHKRVWRVYKSMRLNLPRRAKKRLPGRVKQPQRRRLVSIQNSRWLSSAASRGLNMLALIEVERAGFFNRLLSTSNSFHSPCNRPRRSIHTFAQRSSLCRASSECPVPSLMLMLFSAPLT